MRATTLRKIAGAVGAVAVVLAPSLPIAPEWRQVITDVGALLAYLGHAPDVKRPPTTPESE